jgi:hypothetical protein
MQNLTTGASALMPVPDETLTQVKGGFGDLPPLYPFPDRREIMLESFNEKRNAPRYVFPNSFNP